MRLAVELRVFRESATVGVGHHPQTVSLVIGTNGRRGYTVPPSIVPALGQVSENSAKVGRSDKLPSSSDRATESWYVFQEDVARSYLVNDASGVGPEVAVVLIPKPFACATPRLAREARSDNIHASTPGSPVEYSGIVPDGSIVKESVSDPGLEDLDRVGGVFDIAYGSPLEEPFCGEESSTCSGK